MENKEKEELRSLPREDLIIKLIEEEKESRREATKNTDKIIQAEKENLQKQIESEKEYSEKLFANTNRWIFGLIVILAVALITVLIKT
jgi:hypothetical protein